MRMVVLLVSLQLWLLLFLVAAPFSTAKSGSNHTSTTSSNCVCSGQRDDIRLFGSGADAGRVEMCHDDGTWRYVCAESNSHWNLATATVACRQLGYASAFMANTARAMAFVGNSGVDPAAAGILVVQCQGDEATLRDCQLQVANDDKSQKCTLNEAVGAACSTAQNNTAQSTYPYSLESVVQHHVAEIAAWSTKEPQRLTGQQPSQSRTEEQEEHPMMEEEQEPEEECSAENDGQSLVVPDGIPTPFGDLEAIQDAFVFSDAVVQTYKRIEKDFNRTLMQLLREAKEEPITEIKKLLAKIQYNALGMDLSALFPAPMTLREVQRQLQQSPALQTLYDLYLADNQHNALHWYLDSPYRYYSQPTPSTNDQNHYNNLLLADPSARNMLDTLQRQGIVLVQDFGADFAAIVQTAEAALQGEALYRKNETSIAGGGSILTSRKPIAALEDLLLRNRTVSAVIQAYLGPSALLHGYKVTRLTSSLRSTDQYNAGLYHHDRVGRRLKLFYFLHNVDCEAGHPTRVAAGSHRMLYYKTEDYPVTRFLDAFVESEYDIVRGCGQAGGGFLFDTHTLHKGTVHGSNERTVAIAEYHHVAKCAYSKEYQFGIPCPAGDIYRIDEPLTN